MHGSLVEPGLRVTIAQKVLARADNAVLEVLTLQALDVGRADLAVEVGILAISLFHAAPAGVTRHIQHRRQGVAGADRAHLLPDDLADPPYERGVPGSPQADALGKDGGATGAIAAGRLLVYHRRNAQTCLLQ